NSLTINGGPGLVRPGGASGNTYTITDTPINNHVSLVTTLNTSYGSDTINVLATTGPLTISTQGSHLHFINVSPQAHNLDAIRGALTVNGDGADYLVVNDQLNQDLFAPSFLLHPYTLDLTSTSIVRTAYTWTGRADLSYLAHVASIAYDSVASVT